MDELRLIQTFFVSPIFVAEEFRLKVSILKKSLLLLLFTSILLVGIAFFARNWIGVGIGLSVILLLLLSQFMLSRGSWRLSTIMMVFALLVGSLGLQYLKQGSQDVAIILYPVLILLAALLMQRRLFWSTVAVTILFNGVGIWLATMGILPNSPLTISPIIDLLFLMLILILMGIGARWLSKHVWLLVIETQQNEEALLRSNRTLERQTLTLQKSESEARQFQERLQTLHEVGFQLASTNTLTEMYREAIILGRERLGFDRLGLLLYDDETRIMYGTFGTDDQGNLRDESYFQQEVTRKEVLDLLDQKKRMGYWAGEAILDNGKVIGHGWHATAVLWNGDRGIGYLSTDNYIRKEPPTQIQLDLLTLYGATVGHLISIKQAELNLQKYAQELERSNKELQDFAFVSSHDLQEPLRKIQAFSDRLMKKYDTVLDERGVHYLDQMQSAAARMQTLIQDVLTYSKVNSAAMTFVQVDVNAIVLAILSDFASLITTLHVEVQIENLPILEAEPTQMWQLFHHLLSNALKFHCQNGRPLIVITAKSIMEEQEPMVEFQIKDNGIGFAQADEERVFGMLQRLHSRSQYEGSGMGLAICKRIVDRHNGRIEVSSLINKGTTFTICLPAKQIDKENQAN